MIILALKNVWKRKVRSILTVLGILAAIQLYVLMSGIMDSYDVDLQKQVSMMAGRVIVLYKTDEGIVYPPLNTTIEEKELEGIKDLPNVDPQRSSSILFQTVVQSEAPNTPPKVLAIGIEPGQEAAFLGDVEADGRQVLQGDYETILGNSAAEHYQVKVGDVVPVREKDFKVVGILPETSRLLDGAFLLPLTTAQSIFVRPALISGMILTANRADQATTLAQAIEAGHPKLTAATSNDIAKSAAKILETQRTFFAMINSTSIAIAAVIITIVMVMAVNERKKEIGTLKAIGASRSKILSMIITESLVLSTAGGLLSLPVAVLFHGLITNEWNLDLAKWADAIIVAIILGILAGLWPAWAAQRVNPLESLRYE